MTVNIVVIVELSVGGTFIPAPSKSSKNHIPVVQNFFFRYNYCFFRVELKKKQRLTTPLFAFHVREGTRHFSCLEESS